MYFFTIKWCVSGCRFLWTHIETLLTVMSKYKKHKIKNTIHSIRGNQVLLRAEKWRKNKKMWEIRKSDWSHIKWNANVMLMSRGMEGGGECQVGGKVWLESALARQQANGQRLGEQWAGYPWCLDEKRNIKRWKDGETKRERDLRERPHGLMNAD